MVVEVVGYCMRSKCGSEGDGVCKGCYLIVVGVLWLSLCCVLVVVVVVGL